MSTNQTRALRFRPAGDADAEWATAIYNAINPDQPREVSFTRWEWGVTDGDWYDQSYAAELDGEPVGWLMLEHILWPKNSERVAAIEVWLDRSLWKKPLVDEVYGHVEHDARELGAALLTTRVRKTAPELIEALVARGYVQVGEQRYWQLDLSQHRDRLLEQAAETRARAEHKGFRLSTLAEDSAPDVDDLVFKCFRESRLDMPTTNPRHPISRSLFDQWLHEPRKRRDRFWIARSGSDIAGLSALSYPEAGVGTVETAWTGTARRFRRLGLARALKLQTLAQAIALGVTRVRTDNDSTNTPILHINEELGYVEVPGHVKLHLDLHM